jgi:photosystem II stability/assembly factor-like uncharacterized protein
MNIKIFFLVISLLYMGCAVEKNNDGIQLAGFQNHKELWEQVPLRSLAQKNAGIAGGEGMNMVFGIAYAPSSPNTVYLISDQTQVWKSTNGGDLWQMKHKGFLSYGGIALSVDPANENVVFAAGSLHNESLFSPADGIYRTIDGGENWKLVRSTPFFRGHEGEHFAFDVRGNDSLRTKTVYAGTHQDGLLISSDGGDNWESIGFKGERILDMELDPDNPSILFLLTVNGFYRVVIENYVVSAVEGLGKDLIGSFKTFVLNPKNSKIIYMAMGKKGVYKSIDGGRNFFNLYKGLMPVLNYTEIAISPVNPDYLYVSVDEWGGINPFWSHDGGETWSFPKTLDRNDNSFKEGRYFSAPVSPHPLEADVAITSANGAARILKTDDGGLSWFYSGTGYTGGRKGVGNTSQAFFHDPQKMIFFLMDHGPALTEDGGQTFRLLNIPSVYGFKTTPVGDVSPNPDDKTIVTAIGDWRKHVLAVSRNSGENWELIAGTEDDYKFISFHPQKHDIIYAQGFVSRDDGISWKPLLHKIYAIFRGNGNIVYSVENYGGDNLAIIRSDDQGRTWTTQYPYLPLRAVNEIDVDPLDPDRIYVASQVGLYIYDDKRAKWLKRGEESGLSKDHFGWLSFKCVAVDLVHPEVVYTGRWAPGKGHSNGIFRSVDYGKTWENITYNLGPEITIWSVSVSPHDGTVFLGSSHGTWKMPPPYNSL